MTSKRKTSIRYIDAEDLKVGDVLLLAPDRRAQIEEVASRFVVEPSGNRWLRVVAGGKELFLSLGSYAVAR